jgi:hypothetical protein
MGWGFRKSVKFGPMRVNFSKSGIGVSAGVKGARVSVGPRGTHLNIGRGPFYYRQKLRGSSRSKGNTVHLPQPNVVSQVLPPDSPYQRPAFPKHGLPRIVLTLGLLALIALVIGSAVSSNMNRPSSDNSQTTSAPALKAVSAPSPVATPRTSQTSKRKTMNEPITQPAATPATSSSDRVYGGARQSASTPMPTSRSTSRSGLIRGPRGGCYYYSASGGKVYVDRSMCN